MWESLSAYFKDLDEADKPAYVKKTHAEYRDLASRSDKY